MIALFPIVHSYIYIYIYIYIYQSCDCHIFSLVTVLGNMYNLCELHSLICMCSGCHSLSECTFLYNYRYKYRYETVQTTLFDLRTFYTHRCFLQHVLYERTQSNRSSSHWHSYLFLIYCNCHNMQVPY